MEQPERNTETTVFTLPVNAADAKRYVDDVLEPQFEIARANYMVKQHQARNYASHHRVRGVANIFGFFGVLAVQLVALTAGTTWGYSQPGMALVTFIGALFVGATGGYALVRLIKRSNRHFEAARTVPDVQFEPVEYDASLYVEVFAHELLLHPDQAYWDKITES